MKTWRMACTAAFCPPGHHTSIWCLIYLIAMGLKPTDFLDKEIRLPRNKIDVTCWGHFPAKMSFAKSIRALNSSATNSLFFTSATRCWGWKLSGPHAESFKKEFIAYSTSGRVTFRPESVGASFHWGMYLKGVFPVKQRNILHSVQSRFWCHRIWVAARMFLSSILAVTAVIRFHLENLV